MPENNLPNDKMGSITHVTAGVAKEGGNEEETPAGSILNHYEYDAWGNPTVCEETVENRFRFNGQQYDPVVQQYYLRARFYNPVIARFTQEDTYRGDELNLYAYCKNNPVYYVDPSGHFCEKAAERISRLIDEGRIKGENREKLKSYLQERIDSGNIMPWEQKVADKLGVGGNNGDHASAGGSNTWTSDKGIYSVAYEIELPGNMYPGVSDAKHFQEANRQLHEVFVKDPAFAQAMETLYPGIIDGVAPGSRGAYPRTAPTPDVTWHHEPNRAGILQLMPTEQHTASGLIQSVLHPNGRGGMQNWGGGRRRKK